MMQTTWAVYQDRVRWIAAKLDGPTARRRHLSDLFFSHFFGQDFPQSGKKVFTEHNDFVRSLVPPVRFLEHRATDGWGPLCNFLGKAVPQDKEYPNTNDIKSFLSRFQAMNKEIFTQVIGSLMVRVLPVVVITIILCWTIWGSQ